MTEKTREMRTGLVSTKGGGKGGVVGDREKPTEIGRSDQKIRQDKLSRAV